MKEGIHPEYKRRRSTVPVIMSSRPVPLGTIHVDIVLTATLLYREAELSTRGPRRKFRKKYGLKN
jgi:ribosomal protein L31